MNSSLNKSWFLDNCEVACLDPLLSDKDLRQIFYMVANAGFKNFCINSDRMDLVCNLPRKNPIKIGVTAHFPFGNSLQGGSELDTIVNMQGEYKNPITDIDVVLPLNLIKNHKWEWLKLELKEYRRITQDYLIKGIIEFQKLTGEEAIKTTQLLKEEKWDMVKTSSGYNGTIKDMPKFEEDIDDQLKNLANILSLKVSGGIRNLNDVARFVTNCKAVKLGVGWKSALEILKEFKNE